MPFYDSKKIASYPHFDKVPTEDHDEGDTLSLDDSSNPEDEHISSSMQPGFRSGLVLLVASVVALSYVLIGPKVIRDESKAGMSRTASLSLGASDLYSASREATARGALEETESVQVKGGDESKQEVVPATPPHVFGNCANPHDLSIYQASGLIGFNIEVSKCARQCWGVASCVSNCFMKAKNYSKPCADCFGGIPSCTMSNCFMCVSGSAHCGPCTTEHCLPPFALCSGLNPSKAVSFFDKGWLTSWQSCSACKDVWDPEWSNGDTGTSACLDCINGGSCRDGKSPSEWCSSDWAQSNCAKTCCEEGHGTCRPMDGDEKRRLNFLE